MKLSCFIGWLALLMAGPAFAERPSATPANVATLATKMDTDAPFWLREVWVPAGDLDPVLARYPRAVPLSREQVLTLLRDAHAADPAATDPARVPPERAVLRQAKFDGRLAPGPDGKQQVRVEGSLEVEVLADAWADVPLGLAGIALGTAELDDAALGRASLRRSGDGPDAPARLQLQGRGVHRLRLGFALPVGEGAEGNFVNVPQVDGAGEFTLHLPVGARADSPRGCAVQAEDGGTVAAQVPLGQTAVRLNWRTPPPAPAETGALMQEGAGVVTVEAARVVVRQSVMLRPALGRLPAEARLTLPAGVRAVRVEDTAGKWSVGGDGLRVTLNPAGGTAGFTVLYDLPLNLDPLGTVAPVIVPWLEVVGAHRVTGQIRVLRGAGVQVRRVEPGTVAMLSDDASLSGDAIAVFNVADLPAPGTPPPKALTVQARRTTARFDVDADARADFQLDGVHVRRTLAFRITEGEVFNARVRLPHSETLLNVHPADKSSASPDWRQEGDELLLSWNAGLAESSKTVLVLDTRADLTAPKPGAPTPFALEAALVPGAERLTGYVALTSNPALRLVATGGEETMERRDGRTTPVRGDVAWFYREGFRLALRVERRAAETEARFTGYVLPVAGAVEIHAQMDYRFLFSRVEEVKIRVPRESADAFFFTGPHIAERRLDGDVWTIRFQGEQGDGALGIQATIPSSADKDDAQRFHFRLPAVVPLNCARWSGAWVVEANTDTEIRLTAAGANEADALHPPPLEGYHPARQVIGVFEFTGGRGTDAAIDLDGVRHPAAGVAAAVVDRLDLETFVSTSGAARYRAALRARTAGDGFFDVRLPDGAALWSLTRDGAPVKPVGGNGATAGVVRVELPGGRAPADASTVVVVYETPGPSWTRAGKRTLAAPTFAPGVPVVSSSWKLHVPDGFNYRFSELPSGAVPAVAAPGDLFVARLGLALGNAVQSVFSLSSDLLFGQAQFIAAPSRRQTFSEVDSAPMLGEQVQELTLHGQPTATPAVQAAAPADTARSEDKVDTAAIQRWLSSIIVPHVNFQQTPLQDAITSLQEEARRQSSESFSVFLKLPPGPVRPAAVNGDAPIPGLPPGADGTITITAPPRITLTLTQIPLLEALKYVASQASLKVKVEPYAVSIVPVDEQTDVMVTADFRVPPNFISNSTSGVVGNGALAQAAVSAQSGSTDTTGVGSVTIARQDAKSFLEAQGMTFPPGASATYLASTGKLVVRNTKENLDLLARITGASQFRAGNRSGTFGISANAIDALLLGTSPKPAPPGTYAVTANERAVGLLPLRFDLPDNGRLYTFAGGGEPGALEFRYTDWRTSARWRWVCLTLGALGFLVLAAGWAHPWRRTFYAVLALTFLPLIVAPSSLVTCNALLAGWLCAVAGWGVTRFLLRPRRPLAAVAALFCLGTMPTSRAETPPAPTAPEMVIVPYDVTKPVTGQQPLKYYLPYERFLTLWDAAKQHRRPPVPEPPPGGAPYILSTARYDARLDGDALEITAAIDFQTTGDGWVGVPLTFDGLSVAALTLDGASAVLSGDGKLWTGTPGAHRLIASLRRRVGNTNPGASYSWKVPPTAATLLTLTLPRADRRVEIRGRETAGVIEESTSDGGRRLTASLGGTSNVEIAFRDAPPPAPAAGQPALAHVETRLVAGTRAETVRTDVSFAFSGGTQDHFTVFLDRSLTLTALDAPDIKEWRLDTTGERPTLDLTLNTPARDAYHLALTADRPLPALPAGRRAFPVVSARAGRVENVAALRTDGTVDITLADGPPADARRVTNSSQGEGLPVAAFEGGGTRDLVYNVRARAEKRDAHINYLYQIGRGKVDLAASVRLTPVATADLRLPPGFAVQAVAGATVGQWWREGDVLSLRFKGNTEALLVVYLVRQLDHAPEHFTLQPLTAEGFTETDGIVVVAADRAVKVGLTLPTGARASDLSEIDPATAAGEFQVKPPLERQRAFRYRGAAFEVAAALETQAPRWQAQWVTRATVREGVVSLETHVNVQARQGAADTLEFTLPAGLPEARVHGPDVRETLTVENNDKARRTYRVLFQNPVYANGELAFIIDQDMPIGTDGRASLPDLTFPENGGGRSAGGFLLVENASDGEMTLDAHGLDPAIEKDIPFLPPEIVAGTRFFRAAANAPWSLSVRVAALEKPPDAPHWCCTRS